MKKIVVAILCIFLPNVLLAQESIEILDVEDSTDSIIDEITTTELNEETKPEDIEDIETPEIIENNEETINENNDEDTLKEIGDDNGLGNIYFGFCNQGSENLSDSLNVAIEPGETYSNCMLFYNDANQDIVLNMEYTILGKDQFGTDSCTNDTSFEQYIKNIDQIRTITVPAGQSIQLDLQLNFPIGVDGNIGGCVEYDVKADKKHNPNGGLVLETIVKKAFHMQFFVGAIENVKNELEISNIETFFNENKELTIKFNIKNIGNLENSLDISGNISNIFGYKKDFVIEGGKILPDRELPIEVNIGTIASYGGLFNIDINVTSTPFFSYDISNSSIEPSLLETKEFTASTTFFQMPWLILIILIILILLIVTIFRKPKQKVIYVQAPQQPQQPIQNPGYQQPQYTQPQQPQYQVPQQPTQPQQPQYPNNPQYGQQAPQNPQATPPQYNPNN